MSQSIKQIVPDNNSAAHFKAARKALGLTQQELADRLLLSQNYVAQIEMGRKHPSGRVLTTLETLTKAIDSGATPERGPVHEEQAAYGTPGTLETEARRHLDSVIAAAKGEPARLG